MAFGSKKRIVDNGTSINPKVEVLRPSDRLNAMFGEHTVDIKSKAINTYVGVGPKIKKRTNNTDTKVDNKSVNKNMIEVLNKAGFFGYHNKTPLSDVAIHGFNFQHQKGQRPSTAEAMGKAWSKVTDMKDNKSGALYVFDLETFGSSTKDLRWKPQGITEFAMRKHDFATDTETVKNILLTTDDVVEKLDNFLTEYNKLIKEKSIDRIKKENHDIYVTAMRMSLYDPKRGAEFELKDNVWEAKKLISTDDALAGNIDAVTRGVNQFKSMNKQVKGKINPESGLSYDVTEMVKAVGEMNKAMEDNTGVVGGHNIITFDRPVLDKSIRDIYNKQAAIANNPDAKKEDIERATKAMEFMKSTLGDVGFNFKKGNVLDTYPVVTLATNEFGFESPNLQLGTLAGKYYKEEFNKGTAHLGSFDVEMNMKMILEPSKELDNESLIQHLIEKDITKFNEDNPAITLNSNQVFKATNNVYSSNFSNRSFINYREYNNGNIYTNGGFVIDDKGKVTHTNFSGNTGFNKNGFYTVKEQNVIKVSDLGEDVAKQLRETYTDLSSDNLYHVAFASHTKTVDSNPHTVHIYATTQEELEGIIGSNLVHVANKKDNGYELVEKNKDYVLNMSYNLKTKDIISDNATNHTEIMLNAMKFSEKQTVNEAANRAVFNNEKKIKKISGLLSFDKEARKNGLDKGLDKMLEDGVSLSTILKKGDGAIDVSGPNGALKQVRYFSPEETEQLRKIYTKHMGYKPKGESDYKIDFRTLTNTSAAYESVMSKKDYYNNLIKATEEHFGPNINYDDINVNYFFKELDKKSSVEVLGFLKDDEKIVRAVRGESNVSTHEYSYFKNRYDFVLGDKFKTRGDKAQKIEKTFGSNNNRKTVSYDLSNTNSNSTFINKVFKLHMGSKDIDRLTPEETEIYKNEAMLNFLYDQYNDRDNKELFKNKKLREYTESIMENIELKNKPPEDFNANTVATLIGEAIKEAKEKDITAGLSNNLVGDIDVLSVKPNAAMFFNDFNYEDMINLGKEIKSLKTYTDKDRSKVVDELMDVFSLDKATFKRGIENLDEVDADKVKLIKKIADKQIRTQLDDMVKTMRENNIDFHVDTINRLMIAQRGDDIVPLTGMPKLKIDDYGNLTLQSGEQNLALGLRLEVVNTKDGKRTRLTTNLDSNFGRKDFFSDLFKNKVLSGKETELSDLNRFIKYHNTETAKYTKYSGRKTDLTTVNDRFNISAYQELLPEMVRVNGELSGLLDGLDFNNKDLIPQLREHLSSLEKNSKIDKDSLPPDINMLTRNDDITLALATMDPNDPFYKDFQKIAKYLGPGLKETAYSKGELQIGDRVIGNATNVFDAVSRPPMYGAGNIKYLRTDDIKELKDFDILPGSIIETNKTMRGIYREKEGELLTSDFRGRQVLMSAPYIKRRLENQRATILKNKAKINNATIQQMTDEYLDEVYTHTIETLSSGTFEQARIGDARVFNNIIDMPVDVQYLSVNKDLMDAVDSKTDQNKIQRLIDMAGTITKNEQGEYEYKRRAGTIVKRGEVIAEYSGYGGIKQSFGSKHDKGVLFFSISHNDQELSDEYISKIINQYANQFDAAETDEDKFKTLFNILRAKDLKATYKIENANHASLLKVQDGSVEKGMTYLNNAQLGSLNKSVKSYFEGLQQDNSDDRVISAFSNGMIPHERAIRALHEDIANKKGITVDELVKKTTGSKFKNINELLDMVKDEREALSEIVFGDYGAFSGFMTVTNDNISGHGNVGLNVSSNFADAIKRYSKASGKSYEEAAKEIGNDILKDDNLNFIRKTMYDANGQMLEDKGRLFKIDDVGTFILEEMNENQKTYIDLKRFDEAFRHVDKLIQKADKDADINTRLVHKNVYSRGEDGELIHHEEIVGNFLFEKEGDKNVIVGSTPYSNHAIIADSETTSRVTKEYLDAMKALNEYKKIDPDKLTTEDKAEMKKLREIVSSQKDHTKHVTVDDQMLSKLENIKFNDDLAKDLEYSLKVDRDLDYALTEEKAEFLSKKSGGFIKYNKDDGTFEIDERIKGKKAYGSFIEKIKSQQYYNDVYADELTEEMLKSPEYAHLKDIYNDVVGKGKSDKIGVHNAQAIYDLQGMARAAEFNRTSDMDMMQDLIDNHNFELMSIKDYVPKDGIAGPSTIDSIRDKRIMLDLGEQFADNNRYIAIPAGGQRIGDMEALTKMQAMVNTIKSNSDSIEKMEIGSLLGVDKDTYESLTPTMKKEILDQSNIPPAIREKYEKHINNIQDARDKLVELSERYNRKDTLYTAASKVEIMEASNRAKIISVTSDAAIADVAKQMDIDLPVSETSGKFMKKAKVLMEDGTEESLYDLAQRGIHYDFQRVGIDHFINSGYFDSNGEANEKVLKQFGLQNTQQLIEHLETYGDANIAIRYPTIWNNSLYATRTYLDREFDYKNIKSVSSASMLKYNGDSDGDSESAFQITYDGANFALFEHQRKQAIAEVKSTNKAMDSKEFQDTVRQQVISKGVISEEAYDAFSDLSLGMDETAVLENPKWVSKSKNIILEDIAKNRKAGSVEDIQGTIKNAKSETFRTRRYEATSAHPSGEIIAANMNDVKGAITKALEIDRTAFEENTLDIAEKISAGSIDLNDVKGKDKYAVIDYAMKALESNNEFANTPEFKKMQDAMVKRVDIQHMFEEEQSKGAKNAIGSIDNLLNAVRTVSTKALGDESSNMYDLNRSKIVNEASTRMIQQVISFKKVEAEIGDSRVVELEQIMSVAKKGKAGDTEVEKLTDWLGTYLSTGDTNTIWNEMRASTRYELENPSKGKLSYIEGFKKRERNLKNSTLTDEELEIMAKNNYIAKNYLSAVNQMANDPYWSQSMIDISGSGKKTSKDKTIDRVINKTSEDFMTNRVNNEIKDRIEIPNIDKFVTGDKVGDNDLLNLQFDIKPDKNKEINAEPLLNNVVEEGEKGLGKRLLSQSAELSLGTGIGIAALGVAAGLMIAGYAGGGHQKPTKPKDDSQPVEVTPMLDDNNPDNAMRQQGYIINIKADTDKGARHLKRTLKDVAKASSSNGDVTINMNYKNTSGGGYSNKDIENIINNFI